jgi:hypothetical protein
LTGGHPDDEAISTILRLHLRIVRQCDFKKKLLAGFLYTAGSLKQQSVISQ